MMLAHATDRLPFCLLCLVLFAITATALAQTHPQPAVSATQTTGTPADHWGGASRAPASSVSGQQPTAIPLKIKLPFPAGESYAVIQGNHGSFTHSGFNAYGWDFGLPENAEICAAAAGRVVRVKQDGKSGGTSDEFFSEGNTIILDHGNGYFSQYLHLAQDSAKVREGDLVAGGQVIALSGNTGFSSMPHLHFQVQDAIGQSLPVRFADVPGDGIPRVDTEVTSGNDGTGMSQYAGESYLPPDVFSGNSIYLVTRSLPGHLFRSAKRYPLRGRLVGHTADKVAIYFMAANGGRPLQVTYARVDKDGFFDTVLEPGKVAASSADSSATADALLTPRTGLTSREQSKMYSLAIAPVNPDGTFWSEISVPVCVR